MTYDSRPDTREHIGHVQDNLRQVIRDLNRRAAVHDHSKLAEPELSVFNDVTQRLNELEYGTPEYQAVLAEMGPGLEHHYAVNDHHPEHHPGGIHDMDLLQLTEMLADWKAATRRMAHGDLGASIEHNAKRFGYSDDIKRLLWLTADRLGWL